MSEEQTISIAVNQDCKIAAGGRRVYALKADEDNPIPVSDAEEVAAIAAECGWSDEGTIVAVSFEDAVASLEEGNEKHWTNDGRPDVRALADAGCEMSAKERDDAWTALENQTTDGE